MKDGMATLFSLVNHLKEYLLRQDRLFFSMLQKSSIPETNILLEWPDYGLMKKARFLPQTAPFLSPLKALKEFGLTLLMESLWRRIIMEEW